jgi:DNA-binding NarL/FixJ family response regulator
MFQRGWFLIADHESHVADVLVRLVQPFGITAVEPLRPSVFDALTREARWSGAIVALGPEGPQRILAIRKRAPMLPLLAVLDREHTRAVNVLQAHQVEAVVAPFEPSNIVGFVQHALAVGFMPDDRTARLVRWLSHERGLSAREVQLLSYCLGNEPRARVRRRLGITENTLKTQIKGLLRKCNERNLDTLAKNVLRAALLSERPMRAADQPVAPWLVTAQMA